ncbi:nuclear transport factor 2 family protein [Luteimonas suaedae]|uniref:nuclear transport factor 2 family protein n=1 Tax=Luteimonas suaedae TaxID=2605430 RepID=UPI0011ED5A4D|nr:nuclear transport factor 2 family protein [Luteimonas suaedae]
MSRQSGPADFVQRQLDAYNDHDLARFLQAYTDDVLVYRLPGVAPVLRGKPALADHYRRHRFNLPGLHAELIDRMVFGNKVIDHERVTGLSDSPVEVAAITAEGISKVWFVDG